MTGVDAIKVLVVEDVATVSALIESALRAAGMEVMCVATGKESLAARRSFRPEVVLLDLSLPDMDGLDLVRPFADAGCGVIVVTADGAEARRVSGLETGADDYVVKPLLMRELAARVRAVHRRLGGRNIGGDRGGRLAVNRITRQVTAPDGRVTALTEAEMLALDLLLEAAGQAVSREWMSTVSLKRQVHADDRSVDQLVLKLRRKLGELGCSERTILSVRRQGYVIGDPGLFQIVGDLPAI